MREDKPALTRYMWISLGLMALAVLLLVFAFAGSRKQDAGSLKKKGAELVSHAPEGGRSNASRTTPATGGRKAVSAQPAAGGGEREAAAEKAQAAARPVNAQEKDEAEKRKAGVKAWESLVEQLSGQKEAPVAEQAQRVKEVFDKLSAEDQDDGIHLALNLLQDQQFPVLYGVLFDKAERVEILDAIFNDALNRSEDLKNPLMREIRKDRDHPLFFESSRILDIVEPQEDKP